MVSWKFNDGELWCCHHVWSQKDLQNIMHVSAQNAIQTKVLEQCLWLRESWRGVLSSFSFELTSLLDIDSVSLFWDIPEAQGSLGMFLPVHWAISTLYPVEQESSCDLEGGRGQRAAPVSGLGWMGYGEVLPQAQGPRASRTWVLRWPTHLGAHIPVAADVTERRNSYFQIMTEHSGELFCAIWCSY